MSTRTIPELGPLLGRLAAFPDQPLPGEALLSPVRLALLTAVFERNGWLPAWHRAVASAEQSVSAEIEARLRAAATVSRFPARRLASELPSQEDRGILAARLSAAGIGFEEAVGRLEFASGDSRQDEYLRLVCGELEAAWSRLVSIASEELARWDLRALRVRSWQRPWTLLIIGATLLLSLAIWFGLVLGGYLNVPSWLHPTAEWIWSW